jgi:hypothetical protein
MEKKIKFDEIINFIYKSIKKNYSIECDSYGICIGHKREYTDDNGSTRVYNCFRFGWGMCENCLIIGVNSWGVNNDDYHYNLKINNPKDIARWNILIEDINLTNAEYAEATVTLTDEGDKYAYDLPAVRIVPGVRGSGYINIYPYGRVNTVKVRFIARVQCVLRRRILV